MVLAAYIERPPPAGTEHLHTACKLGGEVKVSCVKHIPVEIEKSAAGSEEWLDAAVVHPVNLDTDRTATSTVCILSPLGMPRVANQRHWNDIGNPANRKRATCVDEPAIAVFYLVQATIDRIRECVLVCELAAEPGRELIDGRTVLSIGRADEEKRGEKRMHQVRKVAGAEPAIKRIA